jgi:hypothetical protein
MAEDIEAAKHLLGLLTVELDYWQAFGALGLGLATLLVFRRWRVG